MKATNRPGCIITVLFTLKRYDGKRFDFILIVHCIAVAVNRWLLGRVVTFTDVSNGQSINSLFLNMRSQRETHHVHHTVIDIYRLDLALLKQYELEFQ